jgi:hypothetical protein
MLHAQHILIVITLHLTELISVFVASEIVSKLWFLQVYVLTLYLCKTSHLLKYGWMSCFYEIGVFFYSSVKCCFIGMLRHLMNALVQIFDRSEKCAVCQLISFSFISLYCV